MLKGPFPCYSGRPDEPLHKNNRDIYLNPGTISYIAAYVDRVLRSDGSNIYDECRVLYVRMVDGSNELIADPDGKVLRILLGESQGVMPRQTMLTPPRPLRTRADYDRPDFALAREEQERRELND